MTQNAKYKVFIDDSGYKEYITPYSKDFIDKSFPFAQYPDFWRNNYFTLCAAIIKQEKLSEINNAINDLKKTYFTSVKVEIKSVWLRNPYQRKKRYMDIYSIESAALDMFGNEFVDIISNFKDDLKLIAVVFDKRFYGDEKRRTPEGTPLLKTTQVLFERLHYLEGKYTIVFDQMESSLHINKGKHQKILEIWENKANFREIYVTEYDKITNIKFDKSSQENFLQVADICAYNVYRQFVEYGREWSEQKQSMSCYNYFNKIRCNFLYKPETRQVRGVGIMCLPDREKTSWDILAGC